MMAAASEERPVAKKKAPAKKKATKKAAVKRVSKARTPPFSAYPSWSTAKFWGFVRAGLRSKAQRWPPRYEVLAEAKRKYEGENKKQKFEYQCALCQHWHLQSNVEVDHIIPCGSLSSFDDLPGFVERMFCSKEGLRVVCRPCHKDVTKKAKEKV